MESRGDALPAIVRLRLNIHFTGPVCNAFLNTGRGD